MDDREFYIKIWNKSKKRCSVTGRYLGSEPLFTFFHHILNKARYPEYRHCEWNIIILSPEVHSQVETNIDFVPEVKKMTQELLEKHREGHLKKC